MCVLIAFVEDSVRTKMISTKTCQSSTKSAASKLAPDREKPFFGTAGLVGASFGLELRNLEGELCGKVSMPYFSSLGRL